MDLAVVQFTSDKVYQVAQLGNSDKVPKGSSVYVAGAPEANETIPQRTLIVNPGTLVGVQPPQDGYALIYNNITQPGMSGGPVLNEEGQVIGIHGQGDRRDGSKSGLNLAIPINASLVPNLQKLVASPSPPIASPVVPSEKSAIDPSPAPKKSLTEEQKRKAKAAQLKKEAIEIAQNANKIETQSGNLFLAAWNFIWSALAVICVIFIVLIIIGAISSFFFESSVQQKKPNPNPIADYTQAIQLNPNDAVAYYNRGLAYYKSEEKMKAIADYTQAIKLKSNYIDAYNNRGNVYYKLGEKVKAIEDYSKAIWLDPNYPNAYISRGVVYSGLGEKQRAINDFTKAAELYKKQDKISEYQDALNRIQKILFSKSG